MSLFFLKIRKKIRRNWRKLVIYTAVILLLLGAAGFGGYEGYLIIRRKRMIEHANLLLEQKSLRAASINAQRVLQLHPGDLEASLIMAKVMEQVRPEEAIPWRRSIFAQRPNDIDNAVAFARILLKVGQVGAAERLLGSVKLQGANNAEYHFLMGQALLASNNPQLAEEHLLKAVEMDARRDDYQVMLSQTQLFLDTPAKRVEARARLLRVSQDKEYKLQALRLLIYDLLRTHEEQAAVALAHTLVSNLDATFADRLLQVEIAYRLQLPEFSNSLRALQNESLESNDHILQLLVWMEDHGMALLAIDWANGIPRKIGSDPRLKLAMAEMHIRLQDWDAAKEMIAGTDWGDYKFLMLALQARLQKQEGLAAQSQQVWDSAVLEANKSQDYLAELERVAESWKWDDEAEAALWKLMEHPYPPDWVFNALQRLCQARNDSGSLRKLWSRKQQIDPTDLVSANNLAFVSLLRGETMDAANKMAADVYLADRSNPYFISTYAFSLYRQNKPQEALKLVSTLNEEQLRDPSTAVCYVAILMANGDKDKASQLVQQIKPESLLPEEKRLLDQSKNALGTPKT